MTIVHFAVVLHLLLLMGLAASAFMLIWSIDKLSEMFETNDKIINNNQP